MSTPQPIVILGPTAGGKSELAVGLAERLADIDGHPGQIIGADSMQVYRYMDAGTAKPTPEQRRRAVHHLIDIVDPGERFTVANWLDQARQLIEQLRSRGVRPIVVGGTNLYIKALLDGLFDGPPIDRDFRKAMGELETHKLHRRLSAVDPGAAARIHPNDRKRLTRALEVHHLTGRPISASQTQWDGASDEGGEAERHEGTEARRQKAEGGGGMASSGQTRDAKPGNRFLLAGLHWAAADINPRINLRVKAMFFPAKVEPTLAAEICQNGESLPQEVTRLEREGRLGPPDSQARQALGYKQVLAAMRGKISMEEAYEQTKVQTRRFAKQQRTWLKRFAGVHWLDAANISATQRVQRTVALLAEPRAAGGPGFLTNGGA